MLLAKQKSRAGVDIGAHSIKMACAERRRNEWTLCNAGVVARDAPWGADAASCPPASDRFLRDLISASEISSHVDVAASLSMSVCDVRQIDATTEEYQQQETIIQKFREVSPSTGADSAFDFWDVSNPDASADLRELNVLAMPQCWANAIGSDHEAAGLDCQIIDGMPHALARAAAMMVGGSNEPTAVLDWGYESVTFCTAVSGVPAYVRQLKDCGLVRWYTALQSELGLSQSELQRSFLEYGLATENSQSDIACVISEICAEPLELLLDELQKTLSFLRFHKRHLASDRIILAGGGGTIRNLPALLDQRLSVNAQPWSINNEASVIEPHILPLFAASAGLSIVEQAL